MTDPSATELEPHLAIPTRRFSTRVVASTLLAPAAWELVLERHDLPFVAGMLVTLHGEDPLHDRDYTLCSGTGDEHLQILYRYIPSGRLTSRLIQLKPGDAINVTGPYGRFVLRDPDRPTVFIATGTGIAPCRSFVRSHPALPLTLLHGARTAADLFYREEFAGNTYYPCVSRERVDGFQGRVTDRLRTLEFDPDSLFYLCGAYEMIYDVSTLLAERGVQPDRIITEAYYYRAGA